MTPPSGPATLDLRTAVQHGLKWLQATDPEHLTQQADQGWWHGWGYGDVTGRMVEAFVLARDILGQTQISQQEERSRRFLMTLFDAEGLSWRPETPFRRRAAHMFDQSSVLYGMVTWLMDSDDRRVATRLEGLVDGLFRIATWQGDRCFYPLEIYTPRGWIRDYDECRDGRDVVKADPCHEGGRQIMPLVRYHELSGNAKALQLATGLTQNIIHHSGVFAADGSYLERDSRLSGHVHSRLATALGVLRLGLTTGRADWCAWAKAVFDWSMGNVASSFGWVSERAGASIGGCETCCITDAIELAIMLAENGHPEYWEIAERFARNHLLESQCPQTGGFSGHTMPSDYSWVHPVTSQTEHNVAGCCSPAGIRGLWLVWDRIVRSVDGVVTVHFPLNRASQWAEVISEYPYRGNVKVVARMTSDLLVRVHDRVSPDAIQVAVNGQHCATVLEGAYAKVVGLIEGDEVTVTHPVRRQCIPESFMDFAFDVTWRGNTVVKIEPEGAGEPLYQRREMDADIVPLKRITSIGTGCSKVAW